MKACEITMVCGGYHVTLTTRGSDADAMDKDQPVFFERFETCCGMRIKFKLPKDTEALKMFFKTGRFIQFEPAMDDIECEEFGESPAHGFGHDAMRGVVSKPDTWEPVDELPEDWPGEGADNENDDLQQWKGFACGGHCLLKAEAVMADRGAQHFDSKNKGDEVKGLLHAWPWLKTQIESNENAVS